MLSIQETCTMIAALCISSPASTEEKDSAPASGKLAALPTDEYSLPWGEIPNVESDSYYDSDSRGSDDDSFSSRGSSPSLAPRDPKQTGFFPRIPTSCHTVFNSDDDSCEEHSSQEDYSDEEAEDWCPVTHRFSSWADESEKCLPITHEDYFGAATITEEAEDDSSAWPEEWFAPPDQEAEATRDRHILYELLEEEELEKQLEQTRQEHLEAARTRQILLELQCEEELEHQLEQTHKKMILSTMVSKFVALAEQCKSFPRTATSVMLAATLIGAFHM
jgi:hypothetical protein